MKRNKYKVTVNELDEETGVDFVAVVDYPAIEVNFISLKNKVLADVKLTADKTKLAGPFLIPNKAILRYDESEGFYDIFYDDESVEIIQNKFHRLGKNRNINLQHNLDYIIPATIVESWIVTDPENDKSKALGFTDLVKGTWFAIVRPDDPSILTETFLKEFKGFSIEGLFIHEKVNLNKMPTNEELSKKYYETLSKLSGKTVTAQVSVSELFLSNHKKPVKFDLMKQTLGTLKSAALAYYFMLEDKSFVFLNQNDYKVYKMNGAEQGDVLATGVYRLDDGSDLIITKDSFFEKTWDYKFTVVTTADAKIINVDDSTMMCNFWNADGSLGDVVPDGAYTLTDGTILTVKDGMKIDSESQTTATAEATQESQKKIASLEALINKLQSDNEIALNVIKDLSKNTTIPVNISQKEVEENQQIEYISPKEQIKINASIIRNGK